ncbi:hypothetical protein IFM12276_56020 [Nocardia sputorum]|uniref:Uncharacterized protein n=1 Tax=Nocardia sputorum TaxID=2984338 RepID=A0ABM8D5A0_9NOCA|nr:hypothetical protein IFM12276_56020 [Nocardia sputorum]
MTARIGAPIVTGSPGASGALMFVMIVVSVGPYPLKNSRVRPPDTGSTQRRTSSGGHASPPATTTRNSSSPVGSTDASAAGVTNAWVTASRRSRDAKSSPPNTVGDATTMVAAPPSASSNSSTEASNDGDAKCSVRDALVTRYRSRCSAQKLASPAWVTTTPFGVPVEPEV